jgi:hypothetical protein
LAFWSRLRDDVVAGGVPHRSAGNPLESGAFDPWSDPQSIGLAVTFELSPVPLIGTAASPGVAQLGGVSRDGSRVQLQDRVRLSISPAKGR